MVKSFKAKPPDLTALELGPTGYSRRRALLAAKGRGGTISPKLLVPHCHLPSKKVSRQRLVRPWSCSLGPLHDDASSPTFASRRFRAPGGFLWSVWGRVVEAFLGRVRCHE
jgi:hypothetical protein